MTTVRNLKYLPYGQARIIETDDTIILRSYATDVIIVDKKTKNIHCTGLYSRTTINHISRFMKEFSERIGKKIDYFTMKYCYQKSYDFNYETGELISV